MIAAIGSNYRRQSIRGVIVMIESSDLYVTRQFIQRSVGERVTLFANKGRRKAVVKEGVIENSYPNIFTIRIENEFDSTRRLSFSYTDILTKVVELVVCKEEPVLAAQAGANNTRTLTTV